MKLLKLGIIGPVFPKLYIDLIDYRYNPISNKLKKGNENKLTPKYLESIHYILDIYGNLKAWQLAEKTHMEDPWRNSYNENNFFHENEISDQEIYYFYSENEIR
ncbi:MAG: Panacea domain-containing protein [Candidatus Phytoplasma sp. TWB_XP]